VKTATGAIIDVGPRLQAVKDLKLDHGQFGDWVEAECGFTLRSCEGEKRACLHRTSCTISASPKLSSRPARVIFSVFFTCGGDSTNPTPGAGDPHLSGKLSDDESLRCPRMQIDLAFPEMLEG
jgi:hypothetical protein